MTSFNIYNVLSSKPHDEYYLKKYINYIKLCKSAVITGPTEKHHICPKAKDLFPEYDKLKENIIKLSPKQHYFAHRLLWKTYSGSQAYAFKAMLDGCSSDKHSRFNTIINASLYEKLKIEASERIRKNSKEQHAKTRANVQRQQIISDIKQLTKHYEIKGIHNWSKRNEEYMLSLKDELRCAFNYEFPSSVLKAHRQRKLREIQRQNCFNHNTKLRKLT